MSLYKFVAVDSEGVDALLEIVNEVNVVTDVEKVDKLSKDFYWYSPVLKKALEDKRASVAVKIDNLETLKKVTALCYQRNWPITVRGGGTGNYGQCIPLCGGVVLDLAGMDRIHSIENGVVRAEPGARLGTLEPEARARGFEFRCLPSTWVKSSFGGFLCGGSGGIGSITWGGIAAGDNVKSVSILTVEEEPKVVKFEERESVKALHTYGTTGIMVEIEMRLGLKVDYQQLIFNSGNWNLILDWTDGFARRWEVPKRLVTLFENPIPDYFKPLKKFLTEGEHATFILVDKAYGEEVIADASAAGLSCVYSEPLKDPLKPPYITDYTWNHTTLWALKAVDGLTYLQCGWGENFKEQFELLRAKFPGEIFQHIEWTGLPEACKNGDSFRNPTGGTTFVGGIPVIRFFSEERLNKMIDYIKEIGGGVANPHTFKLEEGGRHPNIEGKYKLKNVIDPAGLLNPGKLRDYKNNPFLEAVGA